VNEQKVFIENKGSNYFHMSVDLAGLPLFVELDPMEDFFTGKAIIKFS